MNLKTHGRCLTLSILVALVLIFSPCLASAYTYTFRALIDGESDLIIQGNTVQWHNLQWEVPGLLWDEYEGNYTLVPTIISTVDMAPPTAWMPWPAGGVYEDDYLGVQWSNLFTGLNQPLPASAQTVTLNVTEQRPLDDPAGQGIVSISQYPLFDNDYSLIVKFNDVDPDGAAWYTIELDVNPVPIPSAIYLLGPGLLGLAGWRKLRTS